jgi:FtsP/CotA-like multicopper oxidase with cupredoxin domain
MSGITRRDLFVTGAALLAARNAGAQHEGHAAPPATTPRQPGAKPRPTPKGWRDDGTVVTPNGARMPWKVVGGVKVFHLVAEPVAHQMLEGLEVEAWGYNGRTPGPTIEVEEGDRCRFYVTNRLPEATSVHWHGLFLPNGMDGVGGLTQKPIEPGETYVYEFPMTRAGTFMYHPHFDEMTQIALGMMGMIVVQPRRRPARRVRDYALMLNTWHIQAGTRRPNPLAMNDFNLLTFNSKAFPGTEPLVAERGDLVRLRLGNMSPMDHHPIHVHGHAFRLVETDGGPVPPSARQPETTMLVPVGSVRVVELTADALGDWPLHCHMTHHVMNQMGHAGPPLIGADLAEADRRIRKLVPGYMTMGHTGMAGMGEMGMPGPTNSVAMKGLEGPFGYIDMGGMFTLLKIRERLEKPGDPGWYAHPAGSVATQATADQLRRDGIEL